MVNFHNLIVSIFKAHGFEIDSTSNYSKYILANKDNINLSIGYIEPNEEVNVGKLRKFFRTAKRDNADRFIYILPGTAPDSFTRFAGDRNIQVWNRERLEREIGRAVVTDLERNSESKAFESEDYLGGMGSYSSKSSGEFGSSSSSTLSSESKEKDTTGEVVPIMVPMVPLGDDSYGGSESSSSSSSAGFSTSSGSSSDIIDADDTVQSSTTYFDPLAFPGTSESEKTSIESQNISDIWIIKPMISKDKAAGMANKIVKGFRFNLELIPYYVFDYTCKFNIEESGDATTSGILGINGLTSNVEEWTEDLDAIKYLDEPHTKLDVKFQLENAFSLIKEAVIERNTKLIETREEFDSTVIFEKKKLKPKEEAIDIQMKGLYYLPMWCIEGSNGLMIIDAASGNVVKEDIFKEP